MSVCVRTHAVVRSCVSECACICLQSSSATRSFTPADRHIRARVEKPPLSFSKSVRGRRPCRPRPPCQPLIVQGIDARRKAKEEVMKAIKKGLRDIPREN